MCHLRGTIQCSSLHRGFASWHQEQGSIFANNSSLEFLALKEHCRKLHVTLQTPLNSCFNHCKRMSFYSSLKRDIEINGYRTFQSMLPPAFKIGTSQTALHQYVTNFAKYHYYHHHNTITTDMRSFSSELSSKKRKER